MNNQKKIEAYDEIINVLDRHADLIGGTRLDVSYAAHGLKRYAELSELFGFEITTRYSGERASLGGWVCLGPNEAHAIEKVILMGEEYRRTISWSDDGRQPENEWLYCIGFSTGAYYFGKHYPTELFARFWSELLGLEPKYSDTANRCLYFSPKNAARARSEFHLILEKYRAMVEGDMRRMKIEKMEKELESMKSEENQQ